MRWPTRWRRRPTTSEPPSLRSWRAGPDRATRGRSSHAWAAIPSSATPPTGSAITAGLDQLRAAGWRGTGLVRWAEPTNRGFLRSVAGLGRHRRRDRRSRRGRALLDLPAPARHPVAPGRPRSAPSRAVLIDHGSAPVLRCDPHRRLVAPDGRRQVLHRARRSHPWSSAGGRRTRSSGSIHGAVHRRRPRPSAFARTRRPNPTPTRGRAPSAPSSRRWTPPRRTSSRPSWRSTSLRPDPATIATAGRHGRGRTGRRGPPRFRRITSRCCTGSGAGPRVASSPGRIRGRRPLADHGDRRPRHRTLDAANHRAGFLDADTPEQLRYPGSDAKRREEDDGSRDHRRRGRSSTRARHDNSSMYASPTSTSRPACPADSSFPSTSSRADWPRFRPTGEVLVICRSGARSAQGRRDPDRTRCVGGQHRRGHQRMGGVGPPDRQRSGRRLSFVDVRSGRQRA